MRLPRRSEIKTKWKTILTIVVVAAASFSVGALANQVIVQQVQSLAGNHVLVPAPELRILNTFWTINGTSSLVTGLKLNVTTVSSLSVFKLYQIFVQVSCLSSPTTITAVLPPTQFTCSTGQTSIVLPANMNGTSTTLPVNLSPPVDPELVEVEDLSFIVTGTPVPCAPDFTITASPSQVVLNRTAGQTSTNVKITLTSLCNFGGPVSIFAFGSFGIQSTSFPSSVTLPAGGSTSFFESILVATTTPPGTYTVTTTATGGIPTITHSVTMTVIVV